MENQELINKVIVVSAKEEKLANGKPVMKLKDESGLTYSVWKLKKDNTESAAWKSMPDLGETVQIGFVEDQGEYEGKAITYRTIRVFNKDIGTGIANHLTQKLDSGVKKAQSEHKERNWDQEAYEKCCSLWIASEIQKGVGYEIIGEHLSKGTYWNIFQAIKADGKKRFFDFEKPSNLETYGEATQYSEPVATEDPTFILQRKELPTIQVQRVPEQPDYLEAESNWDKTYGNLSEEELPPF